MPQNAFSYAIIMAAQAGAEKTDNYMQVGERTEVARLSTVVVCSHICDVYHAMFRVSNRNLNNNAYHTAA